MICIIKSKLNYICWVIFVAVVKEQEMEIGGPTDVKHVAHIGMDGSSGSAPSWVRNPSISRIDKNYRLTDQNQ